MKLNDKGLKVNVQFVTYKQDTEEGEVDKNEENGEEGEQIK